MGNCQMCGGPTQGYKCVACGAESTAADSEHECGGDMMQAKCAACNQAQDNCTCNGD